MLAILNANYNTSIEPYGFDKTTQHQRNVMTKSVLPNNPYAVVDFTISTSQANKVATSLFTNEFKYVFCTETSHIVLHEVGQRAKIWQTNGNKFTAQDIKNIAVLVKKTISTIHSPVPVMIWLDQPTNGDKFYSKEEILEISRIAHENNLAVGMDCERLIGYLCKNNQEYHTYSSLVDIITLGTQKNGGPLSSTVIINTTPYIINLLAGNSPDPVPYLQRILGASIKASGGIQSNRRMITAGYDVMFETSEQGKLSIQFENGHKANNHIKDVEQYLLNTQKLHNKVMSKLENDPSLINDFNEKLVNFVKTDLHLDSQTLNKILPQLKLQNTKQMNWNEIQSNMMFISGFPNYLTQIFSAYNISTSPDRNGVTRLVAPYSLNDLSKQKFKLVCDRVNEFLLSQLQQGLEIYK